jgi:hypothetical protein
MSGLSHELVNHRLPINTGFRPYKQATSCYNHTMYDQIKEGINWLLEANFTRPCRYAEWISNIVLMEKNGSSKVGVCIDFINLNSATPKYEYHVPILDMLNNEASGHRVVIFLDSNAHYNQIFMAKEDM